MYRFTILLFTITKIYFTLFKKNFIKFYLYSSILKIIPGVRLSSDVTGGLKISSGNNLDFHVANLLLPGGVVKYLKNS